MARNRGNETGDDGFFDDPLGNSADRLPENYGQEVQTLGPENFFDNPVKHSSDRAPSPRRLNEFEDPLGWNNPKEQDVSTAQRGQFAREQGAALFRSANNPDKGFGFEDSTAQNAGRHVPQQVVSSLSGAIRQEPVSSKSSEGTWRMTGNLFDDVPSRHSPSSAPSTPNDFGPRGSSPKGR